MDMQSLQRRVETLEGRLRTIARELEIAGGYQYEAGVALEQAEKALEVGEASFLLTNPPPVTNPQTGKASNAEFRKRHSLMAMHTDVGLQRLKADVAAAEALLEGRKRATKLLEDEFSALRNLVRLADGQMILAASGSRIRPAAVIDMALDGIGSQREEPPF